MRRVLIRIFPWFLLPIQSLLLAQAPTIWGVSNSAAVDADLYNLKAAFSPGLPAIVTGDFLKGPASVSIGGLTAPVFRSVEGTDGPNGYGFALYVQIPVELPPGPTTVVVTSGGARSAPFPLTLDLYSPALIRIERPAAAGATAVIGCAPGETPSPGDIATAFVVGLGATSPQVPTGEPAPAEPLASTLATPSVTFGGTPADVLESVLAPGQVGVYRVKFRLPSWNGWHEFGVAIGGTISNTMLLPVGKTIELTMPQAPESFGGIWACGGLLLAGEDPLTGDPQDPPTSLGGITLTFRDPAGVERPALLLTAERAWLSYVVPAGTPPGFSNVTITTAQGVQFAGQIEIHRVVPFLDVWGPFLYERSNGAAASAIPLAVVVRLRNGVATYEPVYDFDKGFAPVPIDMGPETDQLWLLLFGSGWRNRSSQSTVQVKIGGVAVPVEYAGAQGTYAGLDQVNVRLPRSLAGRGNALVDLMVEGQPANVAWLNFK